MARVPEIVELPPRLASFRMNSSESVCFAKKKAKLSKVVSQTLLWASSLVLLYLISTNGFLELSCYWVTTYLECLSPLRIVSTFFASLSCYQISIFCTASYISRRHALFQPPLPSRSLTALPWAHRPCCRLRIAVTAAGPRQPPRQCAQPNPASSAASAPLGDLFEGHLCVELCHGSVLHAHSS